MHLCQAEEVLSRVAVDGAFLVRPGERVFGSYVISFRADNKVTDELAKHVLSNFLL
jgi:hypothetical protein